MKELSIVPWSGGLDSTLSILYNILHGINTVAITIVFKQVESNKLFCESVSRNTLYTKLKKLADEKGVIFDILPDTELSMSVINDSLHCPQAVVFIPLLANLAHSNNLLEMYKHDDDKAYIDYSAVLNDDICSFINEANKLYNSFNNFKVLDKSRTFKPPKLRFRFTKTNKVELINYLNRLLDDNLHILSILKFTHTCEFPKIIYEPSSDGLQFAYIKSCGKCKPCKHNCQELNIPKIAVERIDSEGNGEYRYLDYDKFVTLNDTVSNSIC